MKDINIYFSLVLQLLSLIVLLSFSSESHAIGSTGNFCQSGSNYGKVHFVEAGDLKYIDMTTGVETVLYSPPSSSGVINDSAYNHEQGLLYFVKNAGTVSNTAINWYDVHTGTEGILTSNINTELAAGGYTGNTLSTASGGGVVLNGHFYFGADLDTSGANSFEVVDIVLSADGKNIVSATGLTKGQSGTDHNINPSSGPYTTMNNNMNWGDVGAQIVGGVPYLVAGTVNCYDPNFGYESCNWSWNLNTNVVKTFTYKANAGGQFGYSENGQLLHFPAGGGTVEQVNVSTSGDLTYSSTGIADPGPYDASGCMAYDYGDSPFTAQTNDATGAKHILTGLRLGSLLDGDVTPNISADATGDDTTGFDVDGQDDDDGVASFSTLTTGDTTYSVNVSCNGGSGSGSVAGWIDFDGNGSFDSNERSNTQNCNSTATTATLTWSVPGDIVSGNTFARFRVAPTSGEVSNPTGLASGGEVEDYQLSIESVADLSVTKTLDTTGPYTSGQPVTYSLVVTNVGPDTATNIIVTDLPTNLTVTSATGPNSSCVVAPASGVTTSVICTISSLAASANETITLIATTP